MSRAETTLPAPAKRATVGKMSCGILFLGCFAPVAMQAAEQLQPIPNRMVVLTFDDAVRSHFTVVRPILRKYGFGATFFVTEGFDVTTNKTDYLTWDEIAQLHQDGFEIGNHTKSHLPVTEENLPSLAAQLQTINDKCRQHGIPRPNSFAYPGNAFTVNALPILEANGIQFARRGAQPEYAYQSGKGIAYEPGLDHPLLIPTTGDARPDWNLEQFQAAVDCGQGGRIAVLQFHGVPDLAHPWVNTRPENFARFMQYLADNQYTVIAMRDLARYIPAGCRPVDPEMVIRDRQRLLAAGKSVSNHRRADSQERQREWLENMVTYHGFAPAEVVAATGMSPAQVLPAIQEFGIQEGPPPAPAAHEPLRLLPYPGGRHPRIGFRDGEIRPQRETKFSVFTPWNPADYVVLDVPEAIWIDTETGPQLLYLAHTHIATMWDKQNVELPQLEWERDSDGQLAITRTFPNGVAFGAVITAQSDSVRMKMWIRNGTDKTLRGLRVQNCVMLARARGFANQDNQNKVFRPPYAACRNEQGDRWIITGWQPCFRAWGSEACPCLHSDPQFPDCEPGQTQQMVGWLSFYTGSDIEEELKRIAATGWDAETVD